MVADTLILSTAFVFVYYSFSKEKVVKLENLWWVYMKKIPFYLHESKIKWVPPSGMKLCKILIW